MEEHCHVEPIQKVAFAADDLSEARIVALAVQGMGCVDCGARVRNSLLALDGVVSADVDWERALALVDYIPIMTNIERLLGAVAAAGNDGLHNYSAQVIS